MFGMVIDTGPSASQYMILRSRSQTYNFYVEVLCWSFYSVGFFAKPMIDLIYVRHGDRNLSKILHGTILTPEHDL